MAQSYLLFDFGYDEEAAQRARRTVDGWKQGFRLDKKMLLKFEREEAESPDSDQKSHVRLILRLDFSDHEKLSYQRWLDRIPTDELFKTAHPRVIGSGDAEFAATAERFQGLD